MVKSASEAASAYEEGIRKKMGGVSAYEDAMDCTTPKCAATKLINARKETISLDKMKSAYKSAYS